MDSPTIQHLAIYGTFLNIWLHLMLDQLMPSKARAAFSSGISFFSFFFREKTGDYRFRETAHPPKNEIFRVSVFLPAKIFIRDEIEGKSLISRFCKNKVGEDHGLIRWTLVNL